MRIDDVSMTHINGYYIVAHKNHLRRFKNSNIQAILSNAIKSDPLEWEESICIFKAPSQTAHKLEKANFIQHFANNCILLRKY